MIYEWDPGKAVANLKAHKVSFREAATVFTDPFALTFDDPDHSLSEKRFITIGISSKGRIVFLAHADPGGRSYSDHHCPADYEIGSPCLPRIVQTSALTTCGLSTISPHSRVAFAGSTTHEPRPVPRWFSWLATWPRRSPTGRR